MKTTRRNHINATLREIGNRDAVGIRNDMRETAQRETAPFPQYRGVYDTAGLVRIVSTKGLRPRARHMFAIGTLWLARRADDSGSTWQGPSSDDNKNVPAGESAGDVLLYRPSYGDCRLPAHCVEWVLRSE
jgi:hypothetical protein